jgi:hypothetical protein
MKFSRWQYHSLSREKQRIFLLTSGVAVTILLLLLFGGPFVLNLAGYLSSFRRPGSLLTDNTKSFLPTTPRLFAASEATRSAAYQLSGLTDPQVAVELYRGGDLLETTLTSADGSFSFSLRLEKGENAFFARAVASNGEKSASSSPVIVRFLSGEPKLDISAPQDGATVKTTPLTISGQTDPENSVSVNDRLAIVGRNGGFSLILGLTNGENKIKITASDLAGNQTVKELTVRYAP